MLLSRPSKSIEVVNLPPHQEDNFNMIISNEAKIMATHHQDSSLLIELDSVSQATTLIAKFNNFEMGGAW